MKYCYLLLISWFHPIYAHHYPVKIGDTIVVIHVEKRGHGKAFIHLHQNETTALKAAKTLMTQQGGYLLYLTHAGKRNVVFHWHKKRYEFDPNRIFTDMGIKKTLSRFGGYSVGAHQEVKKLATKIKHLLPQGKIIAVHNNQSYSLKNYLPGHDLAHDAQALNFYDQNKYRNFYLVTKYQDFLRLKLLEFNSILQSKSAEDDGSLSVYLSSQNYINVEAGYDQLAAQVKMLQHA